MLDYSLTGVAPAPAGSTTQGAAGYGGTTWTHVPGLSEIGEVGVGLLIVLALLAYWFRRVL
jgi:hypothetical protein